jgi:hypothetical protein
VQLRLTACALVERRSQLEIERADHDQCRTFWLKRKNCIGSGKNKKLAPIAIGVELSGLKGKIASALEKNEKLAPIAIGVELRSQLEQERADREKIEAKLSEFKQNFAPAATLWEKLAPDAATILSQLARQT